MALLTPVQAPRPPRARGLGLLAQAGRDLRFVSGVLRRRPFHALVQVTNRCNMQCSFCSFWSNGVAPRLELTLADYRRIAGQMAELGCFLVSVEGGEPLLRPDLVEIVQAFGQRHVPVLYTNGWLMTEAKAHALFEAGVAQVGVSIDYPDAVRHDAKRRLAGAYERARRAVANLLQAAPRGAAQVHVMSVLMRDNQHDLEALLQMSRELGAGHCLTLLSTEGFRRERAGGDALPTLSAPDAPVSAAPALTVSLSDRLLDLHRRHPHLRVFRDYLQSMDAFIGGGPMPVCRAGEQSFNIDHLGNVSPCIERIDAAVGNLRDTPLAELMPRLQGHAAVSGCQQCWTLCRGFAQTLGRGASPRALVDLATRMRSR